MQRDSPIAETFADPKRQAVGLQIGVDGGYFVGNEKDMGQVRDISVIEYNDPPTGQPGLWCQWTVSDDGLFLEWDGGEKFYSYVEWLEYLIDHFFSVWDTQLNGEIYWEGEDREDVGTIIVVDSNISIQEGTSNNLGIEKVKELCRRAYLLGRESQEYEYVLPDSWLDDNL